MGLVPHGVPGRQRFCVSWQALVRARPVRNPVAPGMLLQDCKTVCPCCMPFKFYQQEAVDGLLCGGQPLHVALSNLPRSVQQEVLWSLWAEEEDCAGMKRESFRLWALQVMLLQRSAEVCRPGTANAEKPGSFSMCKHTLRCSPRQRRTAAQGQSLLIKLPCIAKP